MTAGRTDLARSILVAVVALGALLIATPLLFQGATSGGHALAAPSDSPSTTGITVTGSGKVSIAPDLATISVGVSTVNATAAKAQAAASTAMSRIIAALKKVGIADADLATRSISLYPQYDSGSSGGAPRVTGYQAGQTLSVKVRHVEQAGAVIDAAVAAGANQLGGISFSVADPAAAADQARQLAVADARKRAQVLAQAAGVTLGDVLTITETSAPQPNPQPYLDAAALRAAGTPVQVGTTDETVQVQVTFAID
jgi:uncharacterized protein YggE